MSYIIYTNSYTIKFAILQSYWVMNCFCIPSAQTNKSLNAFQISEHCNHSSVCVRLCGPREHLLALLKQTFSDDYAPSQTVKSIDADLCLNPHTRTCKFGVYFAWICSGIDLGIEAFVSIKISRLAYPAEYF